jgi:chaperonin GroEL (HSP60 family)
MLVSKVVIMSMVAWLLQGTITDMRDEKVVQPLLVTSSALNLATECVRMILKVSDHGLG